jgi:hypothetical protein
MRGGAIAGRKGRARARWRRDPAWIAALCVAWTAACAGNDAQRSADASEGGGQCLEGTRWEPRLGACVADAPEDETLEAMCADEVLRPTREIMGEVQDLERQRLEMTAEDPERRDLASRLARGYDELGCATLREATDADTRRRRLKDEPERAAHLEDVARRARRIHESARESAQRYRREIKVSERR